jgi:Domain of unknown function (DUF4145)
MMNAMFESSPIRCRKCKNIGPMKVLCDSGRPLYGPVDRSSRRYGVLECYACQNVSLGTIGPGIMSIDLREHYDILYPAETQSVTYPHFPEAVSLAYEAAQRVKRVDANAFAVLLGRVLDVVCDERKAKGDSLYNRIKDLAGRDEIPHSLEQVALELKDLRNIGAHANLGALDPDDTTLLESLCIAILEYVYTAPALIGLAKNLSAKHRASRSP